MRVVSLVPSFTETLSAWDRTPIACTRFCERDDLMHVGGTKNPDVERIVELAPDLVVMDAEENRREDHEALVARGLVIHVSRVQSVDDVGPALGELARRVGSDVEPFAPAPSLAPRVTAFIPIWCRPWMALGQPTYGSSLLARLGVVNVYGDDGPYPETDLEEVRRRRPDVVLVPSEPYPFAARHLPELEDLAPVTLLDGRDLFWWGARTPDALKRLAAVLSALTSGD
jgi:ABC-type Fe3+-hydroxamate transport system substrate-binding protein